MGTIPGCTSLFWCLFLWRYIRHVVHVFSFWLYRPAPFVANPKYSGRDVTVVLPTVDPHNPDFAACLKQCLKNGPSEVVVVTAGNILLRETERLIQNVAYKFQDLPARTTLTVIAAGLANKRVQMALGAKRAKTSLVAFIDDHVLWGPRFLASATLPFEDDKVGLVGTNKRVIREEKVSWVDQFWNMIQALYLERHNFEIRATNTIDGGVFVVSGRTCIVRSQIIQDDGFLAHFTNERFFFGLCGPLVSDDNNALTCKVVRDGWKVKIQYTPETLIHTRLGSYQKFSGGLKRWARTTWRSNSASLFTDRTVWRAQPWCVYAVYFASFTNFALFYDNALIYTYLHSSLPTSCGKCGLAALLLWMLMFKVVKALAYFRRHPKDLILLPGYLVFTWYHSLVKLWALVTFWECTWSGRNLAAIPINSEGGWHRSAVGTAFTNYYDKPTGWENGGGSQ